MLSYVIQSEFYGIIGGFVAARKDFSSTMGLVRLFKKKRENLVMRIRSMNIRAFILCFVVVLCCRGSSAQPVNESFHYQGLLEEGGSLANGFYDVAFNIWNAEVGGATLADSVVINNVEVIDGLLECFVDFGIDSDIFESSDYRWVDIRVRPNTGGVYSILFPRQRFAPAPVAKYAIKTGTTLDEAFRNGNSIFRGIGEPAVEIRSSGSSPALLNLGSQSIGEAAGRLTIYTGDDGVLFGAAEDVSQGGGGFLRTARNDSGLSGFVVDGNVSGTESARMTLIGENRSIVFDTTVTGDNSVLLPNSSIRAFEMLDEVGASEFESVISVNLTDNISVVDVVASVTIECPADGFVLVLSSSELSINHVTGTNSSVDMGVSQNMTSIPNNGDLETRIHTATPTGFYDHAISTHGLFVASQGSNTFYLLADKGFLGGSASVLDTQLTAVFMPTNYGSISRQPGHSIPDEQGPISAPMSELDILREQNAALIANDARQQREINEMKVQVQRLHQQTQQSLNEQSQD